jgi:hypothetical protein
MKFSKKIALAAVAAVGIAVSLVYAASYAHRLTVAGTEIWRIDNDGSFQNQSSFTTIGPVKMGSNETGSSTTLPTTTTGSNFSHWVPVYNPTGSTIAAGTVLIASDTGTGYINVAPATTDLLNTVGVAAESIATVSNGWMVPRGAGLAVVLTTGTVSIGNVVVTTVSAAGYLTGDTTPTAEASVGVALSAGTASGGSTLVLLH